MKMNKIIKEWKQFLKEVNYALEADPEDLEQTRIGIATAIDRAILSPKIDDKMRDSIEGQKDSEVGSRLSASPEDTEPEDPAKWKHLTKFKDIVKQGRQVPFLYYAYRGIDPDGRLMNEANRRAVILLTASKVIDFMKHFDNNQMAKDVFISDFATMEDRYNQFKRERKDYLQQQGVLSQGELGRADAALHSIGPDMSFSVTAIGSGSKPVSFVNQDFMYKDSPEMHNIPEEDHFLFSPYFPLAIAVILLYKDLGPMTPLALVNIFEKRINPEQAYEMAVGFSKDHQEEVQVEAMTAKEFESNYINTVTTSELNKHYQDVMASDLIRAGGSLLAGNTLSDFLLKVRMLMDAPSEQFSEEHLDSLALRTSEIIGPETLAELVDIVTAYPDGGLPKVAYGSQPPEQPTGFPDNRGFTLLDIVERAESFHYLFPYLPALLRDNIEERELKLMSQAYRALVNKGLTNENNPNTADYGDNRYIREDWYEVLVTPQDLESLASKTQQKSPEEQKVSRSLQQTNRRAKKDFSKKLAAIIAVSNQESPKANEIKKLENFLNRLERKMEDGKVSDFAISEEDRQEFRDYVKTARSKLGINEHLRRAFRRFV
jgi:hypothetical protein